MEQFYRNAALGWLCVCELNERRYAMKESDFVRLLLKNLNGVFHRNHGGRFGTAGLPDIEGCIDGNSTIIEAKIGRFLKDGNISLKSPLTKLQCEWLLRYRCQGAIPLMAIYLENVETRKNIAIFFGSEWIRKMEDSSYQPHHIKSSVFDKYWNLFNEKFIQRRILT